ncbi:zinc-ribbon domain-containing protein [Paenibacillus sp. S33]
MTCEKCGKEIPEESSFCNHCGKEVSVNILPQKKTSEIKNNDLIPKKRSAIGRKLLFQLLHSLFCALL